MSERPNQTEILADRYFSIMLGDIGNIAVLLLQVPAIAGVICIIWAGANPDDRLHTALCLSAIWLGLFNSCREVVKERPIYERERRLFLGTFSYLLSKVEILAVLCALQTLGLLWAVNYYVGLTGSKLLLFITLFLGAVGGSCLGLLVSCLVSTSDRAVALAPVVMLPQVFFCKGFLPYDKPHGLVALLKKLMLVEWVFRVFDHSLHVGNGISWLSAAGDLAVLCFYIFILLCAAAAVLRMEV